MSTAEPKLKVVPIEVLLKKKDTPNKNYYAGKRFYCRPDFKGSFGKILTEEKSNREKRKGKRVEGQGEE